MDDTGTAFPMTTTSAAPTASPTPTLTYTTTTTTTTTPAAAAAAAAPAPAPAPAPATATATATACYTQHRDLQCVGSKWFVPRPTPGSEHQENPYTRHWPKPRKKNLRHQSSEHGGGK